MQYSVSSLYCRAKHQFAGLHSECKRWHPCSKRKDWTVERSDVCSVRSCVIHRANLYVSLANTLRVDIHCLQYHLIGGCAILNGVPVNNLTHALVKILNI